MYRRLILLLAIIVFIICISFSCQRDNLLNERYITVEIQGEVESSGIYTMKLGSTIDDLFEKSGLKEKGDVSQYSLQSVLYNSQVVVVKKYEKDLISINGASLEELMSLPGIGETIGKRIIDYRVKYGSFNSLEELKNVSGIGDGKFNRLKEYICL